MNSPYSSLHKKLILVTLVLATGLPLYLKEVSITSSAASSSLARSAPATSRAAFGRLPLSFELNQGQADSQIKFLARGQGYGIFLTDNGVMFSFAGSPTALRMRLKGGATSPQIAGVDELPGKVNYLIGNESKDWRTNVPTYARVRYEEIYKGVDLIYYGNQKQLEYDFVLEPGASFKQIRLAFDGASKLRLNRRGDLILKSGAQKITLLRPKAYQQVGPKKREIFVRYLIKARGEVGFQVGKYDKRRQLIIDPVLLYSTYHGGSDSDQATGIAVDSSGNAYVTGQTFSANFPVNGALQGTRSGVSDIFVSKLNATGSALVYSTYLGGTSSDTATSITIDSGGNAYVTGQTVSSDFPMVNALDPIFDGSSDAFVAKLNSTGSALVYSTFLGGTSGDSGSSITVDSAGNAYVAGPTLSRDFPTLNPIQANRLGNAIFKTTDSAGNWTASDSGLIAGNVTDLVFHPTNSSTIFAATEAGLFKSTNAGLNWSSIGGLGALSINKIAIPASNPSIIYVATNRGAFKSTDGGNNFTAINEGISIAFIRLIAVDPVTPANVYAAPIGNLLLKSTNGGASWTQSFISGPSLINALVVDPNTPTTIYAATNRGVFKSTNSAGSWVAAGSFGFFSNVSVNRLIIDAPNNLVYAATTAGLFKSTDGGTNWTSINGTLGFSSVNHVAFDPTNTSILYAVVFSTSVQKTTDGGANWSVSSSGYVNTLVNSLVLNPAQPATLFIATSSQSDVFVTKLNSGGTSLVYSTYLGGNLGDTANGIAVDASGNAYLAGSTSSTGFPIANAFQSVKAAGLDAFVTKLNANGSALVYSTFLGGDSTDSARGLAVDTNGNAYITGSTSSENFPLANAFQSTNTIFTNDAFITKLNAAGSSLVYSTYLGGDGNDDGIAIAVDATGHAYVTGTTDSSNFPTLGALQPTQNGFSGDVFVTKLAPAGSSLIHSTYLGGSGFEQAFGLALDSTLNIYVVGSTSSPDFPTVNPRQATLGGFTDAFIAKLGAGPEVEVTMSDSPDPVNLGSNLTYTINVKNNGDADATGVTLTDTLPAGAVLVSANSTIGTCTGTTSINCALGTLNPGVTATITIVITPPPVRTIVNTATVTLNETEAFLSNNSASVQTLVDFNDVSISKKAAQDLVAPGGKLTYSLVVKNKSGVPANVTVTDNLPPGTSLIKCAATGNGVCGGTGNNVSVTFSQLAVGASEAVLLTVGVDGSVTNGTVITNTASASSPVTDSDTSNNSASASITIAAVTVLPKSNGLIAFESDRFSVTPPQSGIFTIKPDGTDEKLFPNVPAEAERPQWSPDGSRLAFQVTRFSGSSNVNEISVINADGTGLLKIASNVADFNRNVTWSPSGSQIAYIGAGQSNIVDSIRTIHIANTDGSGSYRLPGSPTSLAAVDWSPDGTKFVFSNESEIFVINADGTGQTKLTTVQQTPDGSTHDNDPRWSPDGSKIVFSRFTNNFQTIYLMNADGSNPRKLFNFNAFSPSWSPDGLSLALVQSNEIATVDLDNTDFKYLTSNNQHNFLEFSPSWQKLPNPSPTPTPTPAPTFSLTGRITTDIPISSLIRLAGPVDALIGHDSSGNYEFVNLPAGEYTLTPESIFFSFNPASRTVTITNANITGLDFAGTFVPANITGHVKDNNGNPLAGFRVSCFGGFPEGSTFTDANGFYSFPNVQRNRTYFISVDPFTAYSFVPESVSIPFLTKSEVVDFVGTKQPSNIIAGRVVEAVTGQGIPGIQMNLAQGISAATSTFTDSNGNFSFGERKSNFSYSVAIFPHGVFIFEPLVNAPNPFARIEIPSLTSNQNLLFTGTRRNTVGFLSASPSVTESNGSIQINVRRTGDALSPATVNFATSDTAGLTACTVVNGKASERCDFATTVGTLRFGAGEGLASFTIPIVDDAHVEGNETFTITLSGPVGAQMGTPSTVTFTILDNDTSPATQNPIDGIPPFITQQYIDFLGRLPDTIGFANWLKTLSDCPNGGFGENDNPTCDRVHVSAGFFLSDEFRGRGYWAYRFYEVGFNRRPLYVEFVPDMAQVGGPQSPESELLSKAAYMDAFVQRSEFITLYNTLSNSAYVNALEQNAEITLSNKAALIAALDSNQKTRAQVLREIVESKAVEDQFFIRAFVAMQYFGYLRRDPDTIGYNNWVTTLTADPSNFRHMIFGFIYSNEYRGRFGP